MEELEAEQHPIPALRPESYECVMSSESIGGGKDGVDLGRHDMVLYEAEQRVMRQQLQCCNTHQTQNKINIQILYNCLLTTDSLRNHREGLISYYIFLLYYSLQFNSLKQLSS